jgi:hypothetical protein
MESLPNEIIDMIAWRLDIPTAVRFSRTCWRTYAVVSAGYEKLITRRKLVLDELAAIKYQICERGENVRDDCYGKYCSIRTYPDRTVGVVHCTAYDYKPGDSVGIESTVFFSTDIKLKGFKRDCDKYDLFYIRDFSDDDDQLQVEIYGFKSTRPVQNPPENPIDVDNKILYENQESAYGHISIGMLTPTIVDGELQWEK